MPGSLTLKIGPAGVRGIAGESLTPQLVTSFAAAFGTYSGAGDIVIGTDTRPSREMVVQAAVAGLLSVGCTPVLLGVVPLPTLQYHIRKTEAAGGICISASHNPEQWNALKFFGRDGIALRPNPLSELTDLYHQGTYPRVPADRISRARSDDAAVAAHHAAVQSLVDAERIRARRFRVAVDCCNGAAWQATPLFLAGLGCDVVEVNTDPEAPFPRDPEPVSENLVALCRAVRETGADLGFAQDADGDRLAIVDEAGRPLGEDATLALGVDYMLRRKPGPVVVSMSTSRLVDDVAAKYGIPVERTRVGEIHVVERMLSRGASVGGEGNGGIIVPEVNPCRDSFVGMALILGVLADTGSSPRSLCERMPSYAIVKRKIGCRGRDVAPFLRLVRHLFRNEEMDFTDGILVRWSDRWLHVRGSNTEPVVRLIAEARTEAEAQRLIDIVLDFIRPVAV